MPKSNGQSLLPFFTETPEVLAPPKPAEKPRPAKKQRFTSSYQAEAVYPVWPERIRCSPKERKQRRKQGNENALRLLKNPEPEYEDRERIFNLYTGTGGLEEAEGLRQNEASLGQYFTPAEIARFVVDFLEVEEKAKVLETSCGHGVFLNYLPSQAVVANEIKEETCRVARALFPEKRIHNLDMRELSFLKPGFDYALGNPPYGLQFENVEEHFDTRSEEGHLKSHLYALEQNIKLLEEGGFLAFVLPRSALEDFRAIKAQRFMKNYCLKIAEIYLPRETFAKAGAGIETVVLVLQRRAMLPERGFPTFEMEVEKIGWNGQGSTIPENDLPTVLEQWRISEAYQQFRLLKAEKVKCKHEEHLKIRLALHYQEEIERKARKRLYILKQLHPKKAVSYERSIEETKHRFRLLDRGKFLLRARYSAQDYLTLAKTQYKIVLRPSNPRVWKDLRHTPVKNLYDLIRQEDLAGELRDWLAYYKELYPIKGSLAPIEAYLKRRRRQYLIDQVPMREVPEHPLTRVQYETNLQRIEQANFRIDKKLSLTLEQKQDLAIAACKRFTYLGWEMGLGKTLGIIALLSIFYPRRAKHLVVMPAMLLDTWKGEFARAGISDYQVVQSLSELYSVTHERFVLVNIERLGLRRKLRDKDQPGYTLETCPRCYERDVKDSSSAWHAKYGFCRACGYSLYTKVKIPFYKHLVKWAKKHKVKELILDESQTTKTESAVRSRAVFTLGKIIPCRRILTGTIVMNNVVESYSQFNLLFRNSVNFISSAEVIRSWDREELELKEKRNPYYDQPFPAKGGRNNFMMTFSPKKPTVLGQDKYLQNFYNVEEFNKIINTCMLRRLNPLEYKLNQITVERTPAEEQLHTYLLEDFVDWFEKNVMCATEDERLKRMLMIAQLIMGLQRAVCAPWMFEEYKGEKNSSKLEKAVELVRRYSMETHKVMVGVKHKLSSQIYAERFREEGFKTVEVTAEMTFKKRTALIDFFRRGSSQVIVSTFPVLGHGINLPEISRCIANTLPWNMSYLRQWFFRCLRLDHPHDVQVDILLSQKSIDFNIFGLVMSKEKVARKAMDKLEIDVKDVVETDIDAYELAIEFLKEHGAYYLNYDNQPLRYGGTQIS